MVLLELSNPNYVTIKLKLGTRNSISARLYYFYSLLTFPGSICVLCLCNWLKGGHRIKDSRRGLKDWIPMYLVDIDKDLG